MKKRLGAVFVALCLCMATPITTMASSFIDVSQDDWFYENVHTAVELGLMNGVSPIEFAPTEPVTLAMAVTLASRVHADSFKSAIVLNKTNTIWYQTYVDYAKQNGIVTEDMDWERNATRLEIAQMFSKSLPKDRFREINIVEDGTIPDVPSDPAVYMLYRAGIFAGSDSKGTFYPNTSISRAEISAVVSRLSEPSLRQPIPTRGNTEPINTTFMLDGKEIKYREAYESVKEKFPNGEEKAVGKLVAYKIDGVNHIYFRPDKETGERFVVGWITYKAGAGTDVLKVGDSYKAIREHYKECNIEYQDPSVYEKPPANINDPLNNPYDMIFDIDGNRYTKDGARLLRMQGKFGDKTWLLLDARVKDGIITDISCGEWVALVECR